MEVVTAIEIQRQTEIVNYVLYFVDFNEISNIELVEKELRDCSPQHGDYMSKRKLYNYMIFGMKNGHYLNVIDKPEEILPKEWLDKFNAYNVKNKLTSKY